ncbi:MAG TPA: hypothetical protein VN493_05525 [Thermoanaerobaculia bacterium]|nr:hypothetical protein [Thermoanaerobaculia bacterium]
MRNLFTEYPFLFSEFRLSSGLADSDSGNLVGELRLVKIEGDADRYQVRVARVVKAFAWDPNQTLYFESTAGELKLARFNDGGELSGRIEGWHRPVVTHPELLGDGDFRKAPAQPAQLTVALRLTIPLPDAAFLQVQGVLEVVSESVVSVGGKLQMTATVITGEARLYAHDLPAVDASRQVESLYALDIQPVWIEESTPYVFQATDLQLGGAVKVWQYQCKIEINWGRPFGVAPSMYVIDELYEGRAGPLFKYLKQTIVSGDAVPIAFVRPVFLRGGGQTSDHGRERAVVVVTDQSLSNEALLAHELGHVLGGEETGSDATSTYWVGEPDTVMHGTGDVNKKIPCKAGGVACVRALEFARVKQRFRRALL